MLSDAEYDLLTGAHPMFDRVPPALNKRLRQSASQVAVPGGAQVFCEGDVCSNFLVVLDGIVRVSKPSEDGRELLLYYVHAVEFCVMTTACLLGGTAYEARGETLGDVVATHIPAPLFRELVHECEEFCQLVFQTMGLRMSMLMRLVEEVAFQRLDRRLRNMGLLDMDVRHPLLLAHCPGCKTNAMSDYGRLLSAAIRKIRQRTIYHRCQRRNVRLFGFCDARHYPNASGNDGQGRRR